VAKISLKRLRQDAASCRNCDLWKRATQTVFGAGPATADFSEWTPRGKRRIHERPNREEILACRMWLDGEIAAVRPKAIVALGATAANALLGSSVRVTKDRGRLFDSPPAAFALSGTG
jgi:uracil-DNA glycosylase